jgi:uncharacterized phiE125 gp8 family phage protein
MSILHTTDINDYKKYFTVITEPSVEPITKEEVKIFARIDGTDEDDLIDSFITSVRQATELYLGRALIQQDMRLILNQWVNREIELPRPPLISITSVKTLDEDDTETTYSSSKYYTITESIPGKLVIKRDYALPTNSEREIGGFQINYKAGYGTSASDVPKAIRQAMILWATVVYETRELHDVPPPEAKALLGLYRVHNV